jgi:hypothetical protein
LCCGGRYSSQSDKELPLARRLLDPCSRVTNSVRSIGDFTRWKEHDAYQTALDRLLRYLRVETA